MCRIDLCGQIGVKIGIYGGRIFLKFNPLNFPMGQFIPSFGGFWILDREDLGRRPVKLIL